MIKLKPLIENMEKQWPSKLLDKYLLENAVVAFSDTLYHGSPFEGMVGMLVHGIRGSEHGEVAEYDTFSTSLNSEVLTLFSEGTGMTGLEFEVKNARVLVLNDIMTFLVTQLPGSGISNEIDNEEEFKNFCIQYQIPLCYRENDPYLPYGYISSLGVDGFMYDYVWKGDPQHYNDESEICFVGKGIEKLNKCITKYYVEGEEFDKKLPTLKAVKKKLHVKT